MIISHEINFIREILISITLKKIQSLKSLWVHCLRFYGKYLFHLEFQNSQFNRIQKVLITEGIR